MLSWRGAADSTAGAGEFLMLLLLDAWTMIASSWELRLKP
jgi:hypothetical protein